MEQWEIEVYKRRPDLNVRRLKLIERCKKLSKMCDKRLNELSRRSEVEK